MKKFFIILALVLATTLNLYAQNEWEHEIAISYGLGTFTDVNSSYLSGIWNDSDKARTKYFSIMPAVKYNWLNRDRFSMYSKIALGVLIGIDSGADNDKTTAAFAWQASAVGAEFGNSFRGFLELGFGEQGILVAGLRYKF